MSFSRYTDVSDSDLDTLVGDIRQRHPHSGQNLIQGHLACSCTETLHSHLTA